MLRPLLAQVVDGPVAETTLTTAIVSLVVAIVTALVKHFAKERARERLGMVDSIIHLVYLATVEAVKRARTGKNAPVLDKAAYALKLFDQAFQAEELPPPTQVERARAQLAWKALHGEEMMLAEGKPVPR
jgi:hypothetical protein